jgi:hypothetical protein
MTTFAKRTALRAFRSIVVVALAILLIAGASYDRRIVDPIIGGHAQGGALCWTYAGAPAFCALPPTTP